MLKIKRLNKTIKGNSILKDLTLNVDAGQVAVLLGRSGAGKSTLLRILTGIDHADSGEISIAAEKQQVGMVFQHFNLFEHLSVMDNITLALTKVKKFAKVAAREIAGKLLIRYGLEGKGESMVHQLSGGQKQRLAIARTVALDPQVICLDEPTSALDPHLTRQVAQYISDLAAEGKVVIVTSHDLGLVDQLEASLYYMEKGAIAECSTTSAFRDNRIAYPMLSSYMQGIAV